MPPLPRRLLRPLLAAVVATGVLVGSGVLLLDGPGPDDGGSVAGPTPSRTADVTPEATPTPLSELATDDLVVRRRPFCPAVSEPDVVTALGGEIASATVYGNGDQLTGADLPDGPDVAHEEGCRWDSTGDRHAAAWVFVPPVTQRSARALVRSTAGARGCTRTDAPAYGAPSVALVCMAGHGAERTRTASLRGLFGDAWLTCTLTGPASDVTLLDRTEQWCADVAVAATAGSGG